MKGFSAGGGPANALWRGTTRLQVQVLPGALIPTLDFVNLVRLVESLMLSYETVIWHGVVTVQGIDPSRINATSAGT